MPEVSTKRSPRPVPATPPFCAAACCSCPYGCGGTPTGRPPPGCRRHAQSCATSPAPTEPSGPRDRLSPSTRSTRLRQGLRLSVALGVAPRGALRVARPAGPSPCPCRSPRCFAVVGSLTSPLRLLCPCPLAGVKEEGTGGRGGAAAAGDQGARSAGCASAGAAAHRRRQPGDRSRDGSRRRPGAVLPVPRPTKG